MRGAPCPPPGVLTGIGTFTYHLCTDSFYVFLCAFIVLLVLTLESVRPLPSSARGLPATCSTRRRGHAEAARSAASLLVIMIIMMLMMIMLLIVSLLVFACFHLFVSAASVSSGAMLLFVEPARSAVNNDNIVPRRVRGHISKPCANT